MAIINKKTGFRGYTIDGGGATSDQNGYVTRCLFSIKYPHHLHDVTCTVSNGASDWGAQMGDGTIIPLSSPVILFKSKSNAVVQFTMQNGYPSNSPCSLIYRSDTANISIVETNNSAPFSVNTASGNFAMTIDEGNSDSEGCVNTLIATFDYPYQKAFVDFRITTDPSHWGARMSDGTIVPLRNPTVVAANQDNAVVHFTMDQRYPSNSPCVIVYRSADAYYEAVPSNDPALEGLSFIPVTDVSGVPTSIIAGTQPDLSIVKITPGNASVLDITWQVVSGPATVSGNRLISTGAGTISLKAIILAGGTDRRDFTKTFTITSTTNTITLTMQPYDMAGQGDVLTVSATSTNGIISYQWYVNTTKSVNGATAITGETTDSFIVPEVNGTRYYFCKVSSPGTADVNSNITSAKRKVILASMSISPDTSSYDMNGQTHKLEIVYLPSDYEGMIKWSSSNENVININADTGVMTLISDGSATITATENLSGSKVSKTIAVNPYVPVTRITGVIGEIDTKTPTPLTGVVEPANATSRTITWSIVSAGYTGAIINSSGIIECTGSGSVIVRATIAKGVFHNIDFTSDFVIQVNEKFVFVPVQDIILDGIDFDMQYETGDVIPLTTRVVPDDATINNVSLEALNNWVTIIGSSIRIEGSGEDARFAAKVINGAGTVDNPQTFSKEFTVKTKEKFIFVPVMDAKIEFVDDEGTSKGFYLQEYGHNVKIPITVTPSEATNNNDESITFTFTGIEVGECSSSDASVNSVSSWSPYTGNGIIIDEANETVKANLNDLDFNHMYKVNINVRVANGLSPGGDFVKDIFFAIPGKVGKMFIPLERVNYVFPSRLRCYYPILLERYGMTPSVPSAADKATMKLSNMKHDTFSNEEDTAVNVSIFHPATDLVYHTVDPLPIFLFGFFELYLYPWNPGKFILRTTVPDATVSNPDDYDVWEPEKIPLVQDTEITIEDPFIRVRNIENIPESVQVGKKCVLCPVITTDKGLDCYNPYWDEEEATYKTVEWSVVSGPARIVDGVLTSTGVGIIVIRATIDSGVDEELTWYKYKPNESTINKYKISPKDQYGRAYNEELGEYSNPVYVENSDPPWSPVNVKVDYVQDFTIKSVTATKSQILAELTLVDESVIIISDVADFMNLCNDLPDTATVPLTGGRSFVKNQVKSIEFASYPRYEPVEHILDSFVGMFESTTLMKPDGGYSEVSIYEFKASFGQGIPESTDVRIVPETSVGFVDEANEEDDFSILNFRDNRVLWTPEYTKGSIGVRTIYEDAYGVGLSGSFVNKLANGRGGFGSGRESLDTSILGINTWPMNDKLIVAKNADKTVVNTFTVNTMKDVVNSKSISNTDINAWMDVSIVDGDDGIIAEFDDTYEYLHVGVKPDTRVTRTKMVISVPKYMYPPIGTICKALKFRFYDVLQDRLPVTFESAISTVSDVSKVKEYSDMSAFVFKIGDVPASWTAPPDGVDDPDRSLLLITAFTSYKEFTLPWSRNIGAHSNLRAFLSRSKEFDSASAMEISCELVDTTLKLDVETELITIDNATTYPYIIVMFDKWTNATLNDKPDLGYIVTDERVTRTIDVEIYMADENPFDESTSLRNFGRNFTSLTGIYNIPEVTGDHCMEGFLRGCTSFNQFMSIPDTVTGTAALKDFLRDCTSFDSQIELPAELTGDSVLHSFLRGCTSFNQPIEIPIMVTGKECLRSFLQGCVKFNQELIIPAGVCGWGCLYEFLSECVEFDQPITLPDNVQDPQDIGREMTNFMRGCDNMTSNVTIPEYTGLNADVSEQLLSSRHLQSKLSQIGVLLVGPGVEEFLSKVENKYDVEEWPYTHFRNLD